MDSNHRVTDYGRQPLIDGPKDPVLLLVFRVFYNPLPLSNWLPTKTLKQYGGDITVVVTANLLAGLLLLALIRKLPCGRGLSGKKLQVTSRQQPAGT